MIIYGEPSIGLLITIVIVVSIFIGVGIKNWLENRKDKVRIELANTCVETEELLYKQIEATYKVAEDLKEAKEKLIKAKEIIKELLRAVESSYSVLSWQRPPIKAEAEQFLKE